MRITKLPCKHGEFAFHSDDEFVGRSLDLYGDYSEDEISVFRMILRPDDVAIEVGSNIGALTVPMARLCKKVYAFEPQRENYDLLTQNIVGNKVDNVIAIRKAVGKRPGAVKMPALADLDHKNFGRVLVGEGNITTPQTSLDVELFDEEPKIKFIKLDCEGMELDVLKGAERIIMRDRPLLYVENDREEKSAALVGWLIDHGYRCYWHRSPLFYPGNFRQRDINVFGNIVSLNMVCFAEETGTVVNQLEEVDDHRIDDQMYVREAKRALKRLDRDPNNYEARAIAAHYTNLQGDEAGARALIEDNLRREPNHVLSRAIEGLLNLQAGRFAEGWQQYELRYMQKSRDGFGYRPHHQPHWDGKPTDERVLIWSEQGFGDSIMFVRFMDEVLKRAPNAILEVQPQLYELFELSNIVPKGNLYRVGRTLPDTAFHCSIPSLPATLGLTRESELRRDAYLFADQAMVDTWLKRNTPRIGVCCKGGVASERAYSRDIPPALVEPLAREFGPFMSLVQEGQWESYADTAAAILSLDLVLTVDTSVAHLSGALGVPTWLMLSSDPDWRWQRGRSDSPWYPSMRIFRQQHFMNWSTVIDDVRQMFEARQRRIVDAA